MLFAHWQGEGGTGFLSFPLSWVKPERNDVRPTTSLPAFARTDYSAYNCPSFSKGGPYGFNPQSD